jgi:DNA-binding transcriptional MerR regulator
MKKYQIGDIASIMHVPTSTIRYYDKQGLLPFAKRDLNGRRIFNENDLNYIEVIDCLKQSGIPIKDISHFMTWCLDGDSTLSQRFDFIEEHEAILEDEIKNLQAQLAFLRWKKWYYSRAKEAGTEAINFEPGTSHVQPELRSIYEAEIAHI